MGSQRVGTRLEQLSLSHSDSHCNVFSIKIILKAIKTDDEHCHMPVSLGEKVEATQKQ